MTGNNDDYYKGLHKYYLEALPYKKVMRKELTN